MLNISEWQDLKRFGVVCLTGEACAVGARILCDVTEYGRKAVCEVLGLPHDTRFKESWNTGDENNPHVGSVMLPYGIFPELAALLALRAGAQVVVTYKNSQTVTAIYPADYKEYADREMDPVEEIAHTYKHCAPIGRTYGLPPKSIERRGLSNVHLMSGRSA